jgi:hypothetical protein
MLFSSAGQLLPLSSTALSRLVSLSSTDTRRRIFPLRKTFFSFGFQSSPLDASPSIQNVSIGIRQLSLTVRQRVLV